MAWLRTRTLTSPAVQVCRRVLPWENDVLRELDVRTARGDGADERGTAIDVTLQELRIESLFPADAASEATLAAMPTCDP